MHVYLIYELRPLGRWQWLLASRSESSDYKTEKVTTKVNTNEAKPPMCVVLWTMGHNLILYFYIYARHMDSTQYES